MESSRPQNRNGYLLLSVFTGLVILLLLGIAAYVSLSDQHVVAGVRSLEEDLGGLTREGASDRLTARFEEYSRSPFVMRYEGREWNTTPAEMGIRLDVAASVDAAYQVGRSGSVPEQLFAQLGARLTGHSVAPVVYLDRVAATVVLKLIASEMHKAPQNADLSLDRNGAVQFRPALDGLLLDADATLARLENTVGQHRPSELELAVVSVPPALSDAQLRTLEGVRARLASQPLNLEYQAQSLTIDAKTLAALIKVVSGVSGGGSNDGSSNGSG